MSEEGRKQQTKLKDLFPIAERLGCTLPQLAVGEEFWEIAYFSITTSSFQLDGLSWAAAVTLFSQKVGILVF